MAKRPSIDSGKDGKGFDAERRYAETLHEITAGLLKRRNLDELLETILVSAAELAGAQDGFLYRYDSDQEDLCIRVGLGRYRDAVGFRLKAGEGLSGKVWQSGEPLLVDDYRNWPDRSKNFSARYQGLRSVFGLPLRSGSEIVGVIGLGRYDSDRLFGRREMAEVGRFAELASLALDNAFLQKKLEEELEQRKNVEAILRESELRYRGYFEDDLSGAYISQPDGTLLACNAEFARIFGFSSVEAAKGTNLGRLYADSFPRKHFLAKLSEERQIRRFETPMQRIDGRPIQIVENTWGVFDDDGRLTEIQGYLMDVTEQRNLERQLRQALKMEAIGTLAGGIAHDFNNLLMAIEGNVSLLLYDLPEDHPHHRCLLNIQKQVASGAQLTSHLLGYARKGRYTVRQLDINRLIAETAETFGRTRKQITLKLDLEDRLMAVRADPSQIEQTLLNLFVNAADAMPEGGLLIVSTRNVDHRRMNSKFYNPEPGEYVGLSVSDTGIGMEPQVMERIFDPFFTTKEMGRGTGLGLASVYGIVKGHGGYVDVYSSPGKGTTFLIYLPAVETDTSAEDRPAGEVRKGKATVLLVDDESIVLEVGVEMLKRLGYRPLSARGGAEALALVEKQDVDLVILDLVMPEMSGRSAFEQMRAADPSIRILLTSGYSLDEKAMEMMNRGSTGFLQKPFDITALSDKIREMLEEKGQR